MRWSVISKEALSRIFLIFLVSYSPASANANVPPPPYTARTVYDETHRAVNHDEPRIDSVANLSNLIGYFDHPTPASDGSFAICIAGGIGNFIKKVRYFCTLFSRL